VPNFDEEQFDEVVKDDYFTVLRANEPSIFQALANATTT
jgi:hypothetical protein